MLREAVSCMTFKEPGPHIIFELKRIRPDASMVVLFVSVLETKTLCQRKVESTKPGTSFLDIFSGC